MRKILQPNRRKFPAGTGAAPPRTASASDLEELLSRNLAGVGATHMIENGALLMPHLIYSSIPSLSELAYSKAFSIGKSIFRHSDRSIDTLLSVLGRSGIRYATYNDFESHSVITAKNPSAPDLGANMHIFEAGLMAGFLSGQSGRRTYVEEVSCACNGRDQCRFISSEQPPIVHKPGRSGIEILEQLSRYLNDWEKQKKIPEEYLMSLFMPIMDGQIAEELEPLFYASGKRIAEDVPSAQRSIEMLSSLSGVQISARYSKNGTIKNLNARYGDFSSRLDFIRLSRAMIFGFLDKRYGKEFDSKLSLGKNKNYILSFSFNLRDSHKKGKRAGKRRRRR